MRRGRILISVLLMGTALLLLSACTLIQTIFPLPGELRLLRLQMPQITEEDLPYDIAVTFEAQERPTIKRACFQWLSERAAYATPPLNCYATESAGNLPIDSACSRWTTGGPYAQSSPVFCSSIEHVEYGSPGRFTVKIHTRNVAKYYSWVECYAEYTAGGVAKETNKVRTRIAVEGGE